MLRMKLHKTNKKQSERKNKNKDQKKKTKNQQQQNNNQPPPPPPKKNKPKTTNRPTNQTNKLVSNVWYQNVFIYVQFGGEKNKTKPGYLTILHDS